ncbi:BspA family leucine-rich repeat surface protein [Treponema sp. C6A8]|uniref:BspA family leucine-rich repeat surface protein n=1 Tax=Treponema sp. C6A8 TaxID=1410609 RepID=UPI00047FA9C8|nr:BspA family leucine-rich repeat surface protein [Treponema sp. C6A8]
MLKTLFKRHYSLFLIPLALSISCTNLVDDSFENQNAQTESHSIVYITGNIDSSAGRQSTQLLQIDDSKAAENDDVRAAMPNISPDTSSSGSSSYIYFVSASTMGVSPAESVDGTVSSDASGKLSYTIALKSGYRWKITAGVKRKADSKQVLSDSYEDTISSSHPVSSKNFFLQPASGSGDVNLPVTVDSSITDIEVELGTASEQAAWDTAMAEGGSITTSAINVPNLPAGNYHLTINFKDTNGQIVYSVNQAMTVYPFVTTNKWVAGSSSSSVIDASGNFQIDSADLNSWKRNVFYVAQNRIFSDSAAPDDGNDGSAWYPLASVTGAINKIIENNVSDAEYTIYVVGTIKDNVTVSTTSMTSLTISKLMDNAAVVDGDANGTVFDISTTKPVMFKGITIQNGQGNAMYKGGGISLATGGTVYIEDCHLISNKAVNGGAIYIGSGSTMELTGNVYIPSSAVDENDIYLVDGTYIDLNSTLKHEAPVASVTLQSYSYGRAVLSGTAAGSNYSKFTINNDTFGNTWTLNNEGKLSPLEIMIKTGSAINSALPWNSTVPFEASSIGPDAGTTVYYLDTAAEHVPVWYDGSGISPAVKYYAGGVTDGGGGKLILNADSSEMFSTTRRFTSIDLSYFDASKVTNTSKMFYGCSTDLTMILVGDSFDLSSVTNSTSMFSTSATNLKGGLGTSFDSSKTDKTYARIDSEDSPGYFTGPKHLKTGSDINSKLFFIDAYSNTSFERSSTPPDSSVSANEIAYLDYGEKYYPVWSQGGKNYYYTGDKDRLFLNPDSSSMFDGCPNYETIDLSGFDTSRVTNMSEMFANCKKLTELDLSDFDTSKVTNMSKMFYMPGESNTALTKITVSSGFVTTAVTASDEMFAYCALLIGGSGTTYNSSVIDKTYAHIDGGTSNPGYFTAK